MHCVNGCVVGKSVTKVQTFPDDTVDALRNDGCGNYHTKF